MPPPTPLTGTPPPLAAGHLLDVPPGVRLAARSWWGTAAELGAAGALLSAADARGLAPDAAAAVGRLVAAWESTVARLRADTEAHALALDDTVRDLAEADAAAAQAFTGVLGLTAGADGTAGSADARAGGLP